MAKWKQFAMAAVAAALAGTAGASTIYTLDTTLDGKNVAATAEFSVDAPNHTITLTLENTTNSITNIIQMLTGFTFTLSGNPTFDGVTGMADGSVNCVGVADGGTCATSDADVDLFGSPPDVDGNSHNAAPTGWAFLPNYTLLTFAAGGGSFKPWGIVNDTVVGSGSNGNTSNPPHNPMLLGPVTFTFAFDPFITTPTITGVQFYWGTGGDHRAGVCTEPCNVSGQEVPEPRTLSLLALALLGMGVTLRARARRRA